MGKSHRNRHKTVTLRKAHNNGSNKKDLGGRSFKGSRVEGADIE